MRLIILIVVIFIGFNLNASTVIQGKLISQQDDGGILSFYPKKNRLRKANVKFEIDEKFEFEIDIEIESSQIVILLFGAKEIQIYIEPGETIGVLIDQEKDQVNYFEDKEIQNNRMYRKFIQQFGSKSIILSRDIKINTELYHQSQKLSSDEMYDLLKIRHEEEMKFYKGIQNGLVSLEFKQYINNSIVFSYLSYLLILIDPEELNVKNHVEYTANVNNNFDDNITNSFEYLGFLKQSTLMDCDVKEIEITDFKVKSQNQYDCIKKSSILSRVNREQILGQFLYDKITPKRADDLSRIYNDFKQTISNDDIVNEVATRFEMAVSLKGGQLAPKFKLEDIYGEIISLKQYEGKKVHISFWAKWCGPCKIDIINSNENRKLLKDKEIVFLLISIDDDKLDWKEHSITKEQYGIHLWGGKKSDKIMENYKIASLPKSYLIDENGKFIDNYPNISSTQFIKYIIEK